MGDKGEGRVKNLKKWLMLFMDGPNRGYFGCAPIEIKNIKKDYFFGKIAQLISKYLFLAHCNWCI